MALTVLPHRDELGIGDGRLFIDGEWVEGSGPEPWEHTHPATNESVASFLPARPADVDRAVKAARRRFDDGSWASWKARDRKKLLQRIAELIADNGEELDRIQTLDNGMPLSFASIYQVSHQIAADIFDYHAGWVDRLAGETLPTYTGGDAMYLTLREPVGVVGAVIPWNAPLMLFAQKVAPALAAGCTVVLKPSEYASFVVIRLTELLEEAGVPAGVFNLVLGTGPETGEALITHPGVDKLTFTGSRAVGKRILQAAAEGIKRVSLELGGKSPNIVFPDVDLDSTAASLMGMVSMGLSGQGCVCHTRALVHASIYDEMIDKCAAMAAMCVLGDPFDPATTSGPLINARQLERVTGYIAKGSEEGARLVVGGDRPGGDLAAGNFVNPTLFADVDNDMTIAREEIFGPVLAVIPFSDEDEAIRIANDTDYGLGASVQTSDVKRALRVAKAVRSGTFGINGYTVMPNAPFGGYKTSGLGREGGREGIDPFLETKTVVVALGDSLF
ncbi:MAG: aldehyde dehydrogenase family protein [Acidimicrobiales bacterium]|nr:aldehyde dehydrogenase family protein [Acidimicrobiales bacterium]